MALRRPITTIELINLNKMFSEGKGYKDLIREFKKVFNVDLPKDKAKKFMKDRSWKDVLLWLTGDLIDTRDLDKIPQYKEQYYELLEHMIKINKEDDTERVADIDKFLSGNYYIPEQCKYFNIPLYGEIITYKFKDPMLKCFLIEQYKDEATNTVKRKISKIEDVYISDKIPSFLLSIIRKINSSWIGTKVDPKVMMNYANYPYLKQLSECSSEGITNIFDSELFQKYSIQMKV